MNFVKINLKILIIILFTLNSCVSLPGINKNPSKKKINKEINYSQYSIKDVGINIIKINSLSEIDIDIFNKKKNRRDRL